MLRRVHRGDRGDGAMRPYYSDESVTLWHGDSLGVLRDLPDASVDCCVTSPPYFGLRDYGEPGQYGLESSPAEYVETMRALFAEVRRVLADDGTLWLNIGDSYSSTGGMSGVGPNAAVGSTKRQAGRRTRPSNRRDGAGVIPAGRPATIPPKNLMGIPWRTAFALQDDGWILRNDIIWNKPNAMPESVTDRLSTRHEHMFMFSKRARYWFDLDPIREPIMWPEKTGHTFGGNSPEISRTRGGKYDPSSKNRQATGEQHTGGHEGGRNPGDVWTVATQPFGQAHFAVMPVTLAERALRAGCKPGGVVLDPFSGSGTTGLAAARHGRRYVGIDLSNEYLDLSLRTRLAQTSLLDGGAA